MNVIFVLVLFSYFMSDKYIKTSGNKWVVIMYEAALKITNTFLSLLLRMKGN